MSFVDNLKAKVAEMIEQKEAEKARKAALKQAPEEKKQEKAEEYDYDLSSLDITPFAPKSNTKKEKKTATQSYEESVKKLETYFKEQDEKRDKEIEEGKRYQQELSARIDKLNNSPAQRKLDDMASREADKLFDEINKRRREKFDEKYNHIDSIFNETFRQFQTVDGKYNLDDMYHTLLGFSYYNTIPEEYFKYAYLKKLAQENYFMDDKEKTLYTEIENSKIDHETLNEMCIIGYGILGNEIMAEEKINELKFQEDKDKIKTTINTVKEIMENIMDTNKNKGK